MAPPLQASGERFWLLIGKTPDGPFDVTTIRTRFMHGAVTGATLACPVGGNAWVPLSQVPGIGSPTAGAEAVRATPRPTAQEPQKVNPTPATRGACPTRSLVERTASDQPSFLQPGNRGQTGKWYYATGGRRCGPCGFEQLQLMAGSGLLMPTDMVWLDGDQKWVFARTTRGLFPSGAGRAADAPPSAARPADQPPSPTLVVRGVGGTASFPLAAPPVSSCDAARAVGRKDSVEIEPLRHASPPRRPVDLILAIAALLAIPLWLLQEVIGVCLSEEIGQAVLMLAGLIWVVLGVWVMATGSVPLVTGRVLRINSSIGVIIGLFGMAMIVSGAVSLIGSITNTSASVTPTDVLPPSGSPDSQAQLQRGIELTQEEKYDQAEAALTEAIRLDPKLAVAYSLRGGVHLIKSEYDLAIADFNEAIRLDPHLGLAHLKRGWAYFEKKDYDEAIADCGEAIRLGVRSAGVYELRAKAYQAKGDDASAEGDFREAARLKRLSP